MTAPASIDRLEVAFTVFRDRLQDFLDRLLAWTRYTGEAPRVAPIHEQAKLELQALHLAFAQLEQALAGILPGDLDDEKAEHPARHIFRDVAVLYSTLATRCPDCLGLAPTACPCRLRPPTDHDPASAALRHPPHFADAPTGRLHQEAD